MKKTALITGITGQDGYYLSRLLLQQGYRVVGLVPPDRCRSVAKLADLADRVEIRAIAFADAAAIQQAVEQIAPDEIYHLAAPSFVPDSWNDPLDTLDVVTGTATRLLTAVRQAGLATRFYFASSSEMFGQVDRSPQDESTPFRPMNPYASAKLHAHWTVVQHRQRYGLFACSGISYNHESPLRPDHFVTRKVTQAAAAIKLGLRDRLHMGNLQAQRDWGYAGDHVQAMWRILQADTPEDYVIGTGELHSVEQLIATAFSCVDLDWTRYVTVDPHLIRADEHFHLVANPQKAKHNLQWKPQVGFADLIEEMVLKDLECLKTESISSQGVANPAAFSELR